MTIRIVSETNSTQDDLLDSLSKDGPAWTHLSGILAHRQLAGRGRLEREWATDNLRALTVSYALRPASPMETWGTLGLRTAVAVVRSLREVGVVAQIKWPNDIVVAVDDSAPGWDGIAKIGGVLGSIAVDSGSQYVCAMGVGINLDGEAPVVWATTLAAIGANVQAFDLAERIRLHLATLISGKSEQVESPADANSVDELVTPYCHTLGRHVAVTFPRGARGEPVTVSGEATRIDPDGALVVDTLDGEQRILSGDLAHTRSGPR